MIKIMCIFKNKINKFKFFNLKKLIFFGKNYNKITMK